MVDGDGAKCEGESEVECRQGPGRKQGEHCEGIEGSGQLSESQLMPGSKCLATDSWKRAWFVPCHPHHGR